MAAGVGGVGRGGGAVGVAAAAGLAGGGTCSDWDGGLAGKRGVVFDPGGAPVNGGAAGLVGGVCAGGADFAMDGIGLVTAVDHAGGALEVGAGSRSDVVCIGIVLAPEILGRGAGVIRAEAGFSGRGGRLMRNVSRFGALGSWPSGFGASAIISLFYSYFGKCSMGKSQSQSLRV